MQTIASGKRLSLICLLLLGAGCGSTVYQPVSNAAAGNDDLMVVDCLLPGQVRQLGTIAYVANRKAVKTTGSDCARRGGEYVAYDRADNASALDVWLPLAEQGDMQAQVYVGEIYEKGIAGAPDYALAAQWYVKAATQGSARAAINLGNLFDQGLGFGRDDNLAALWYQRAADTERFPVPENPHEADSNSPSSAIDAITIVEPPLTQQDGKYLLAKQRSAPTILVVGNVQTSKSFDKVLINGQPAELIGNSLFRGIVAADGGNVDVVAYDRTAIVSRFSFLVNTSVTAGVIPGDPAQFDPLEAPGAYDVGGRYFALIVGNNHYQSLPGLDTAVNDAHAVADVLSSDYGFETRLLIDANRYDVLSALNELRKDLAPNDRLLIYYAGHGELDRVNHRGYWLPVDAEQENMANWISNVAITDLIHIIPPNQLIVIADSCYSGTLSHYALTVVQPDSDIANRSQALQKLAAVRTRTVMTSGGVAPVIDGLGGENSVFAEVLVATLEENTGALTGYELFNQVAPKVTASAASVGFTQTPEYAPLKFAGHEAGDFVFRRVP